MSTFRYRLTDLVLFVFCLTFVYLEDNYGYTALARALMEREETQDQDPTKKENLKEIVDSLLRHPQVETSVFNSKKKKK